MLQNLNPFETGTQRYRPQANYTYNHNLLYLAGQQWQASLIGTIALLFPGVLFFATAFSEVCFHHSISHFYYSQFWGDFLLCALALLGGLLIMFRGENPNEGRLATFAGLFVFGIAMFPAERTGCTEDGLSARVFADFTGSGDMLALTPLKPAIGHFQLAEFSQPLHLVFGALLFATLALYSWQVLTRPSPDQPSTDKPSDVKKRRNLIYRACSVLIILAVIWLAGSIWWDKEAWDKSRFTFWAEFAALAMFGISWLVKGRVWGTAYMDPRDIKAWEKLRQG